MRRPVPRPRPIEVLANLLLGPDEGVPPLPQARPGGFAAALERVLMRALLRPPCAVSFSGGRDSSAVLAAAVEVARRHGLEPPIPVTMRFPRSPQSDETSWQELVLSHLGLPGQELVELDHEVEALGPCARETLGAHGLIWPGNAHMHLPVLEHARGGTLLTGVGGDELLGATAPRRSPRAALLGISPRSLRRQVWLRRQAPEGWEWLTSQGRRALMRALAREEVSWPYPWDRALHHWYASRAFAALDGALRLVGELRDVEVINPLLEPEVLAELARLGGRRGFPSRTEAMRRLFGALLPEALLERPLKAVFTNPAFGPETQNFVAGWDGRGVDERHVSTQAVREQVLSEDPDFRVILLVQQAWLAAQESSSSNRLA